MPRESGIKVVNKFSRGLITEATGLNFPEDAVVSSDNVIFEHISLARRRKGFDVETDNEWQAVNTSASKAINTFLWRNVAGSSDINFVVSQVGATLYFWRTDSTTALSAGLEAGTISLDSFKASGAPDVSTVECQFAVGLNFLFVTHPYCDPFYVDYNTETETFTGTSIEIEIRDFEGVDDGLAINSRPDTLTDEHEYNLKNQGWRGSVVVNEDGARKNPITWFQAKSTDNKYPSNSDIWWLMKNANDWFDPNNRGSTKAFGNTPAPKGYYILKAFYEDRSTESDVDNIPVVSAGFNRPSAVAFFAGRVWYAGIENRRLASTIFFSQISQDEESIGKCYQSNDPTSEISPDLLPTDGGTVKIPDIGTIYKLLPIQSAMIVFASNGVWAISGSSDSGLGFTASDYTVRKISSVGAISASSFADVEGFAIWWNNDGIYTISNDQVGAFQVQSITDESIKTFYNAIPTVSKKYAKSSYNSLKRTIQWLYRKSAEAGISDRYDFDGVLNFNMISGGFYPFTITDGHKVAGIVSFEGAGTTTVASNVIDGSSNTVIDGDSDNVIVSTSESAVFSSVTKYFVVDKDDPLSVSWAEEFDARYLDWFSIDATGTDYSSFFITGYSVDGKAVNYVQSNYVFVYINEEDNSSCFMDGIFDWVSDPLSNRYSNQQQVYNTNRTYYGVRVRKLKVRGKGRSIQLRFTSQTGKPYNIIGWSLWESANVIP